MLFSFIKFLMLLLPILIGVAFITLLERKLLSLVGLRVGPNKVSMQGLLQPISDAIKLGNKESNYLANFSFFFHYVSSMLMFFGAFFVWFFMMLEPTFFPFKLTLVLIFLVLGFNSLNSVVLGWSTFSKYSLLGSIRTVSQLISYESVLYLCLFFIVFFFGSFSLHGLGLHPISLSSVLAPILFYFWFPSFLAELNRTPYDFSEGESELVSGFNTEFGSICFTLIFLSEYSMIIFFCCLGSFLFFHSSFTLFFFFFFFFVIWIRSVLPRYRFDKLMLLSWTFFIPFLTCLFLVYVSFF